MGFSPQVVDLDGDGIDDIISGSYWPGHITFFKGLGDGQYAPGEVLQDEAGRDLIASEPWADERQPDMDSLASVPFAYDFNGNGVLDLLVGNFAGHVMLIPNNGTAQEPSFCAETRIRLTAAGEEIKAGGGKSAPIMVDWDGDGLDDLLVGAEDGSVTIYRNVGTPTEPEFEAGRHLIPPGQGLGSTGVTEPSGPGIRAKVHAVDFNDNGRLDLLVGDFTRIQRPSPDLTEEQVARRDELREQQQELSQEFSETYQRVIQEIGPEEARQANLMEREELSSIREKMNEVFVELRQFEGGADNAGFVWLYLRKE